MTTPAEINSRLDRLEQTIKAKLPKRFNPQASVAAFIRQQEAAAKHADEARRYQREYARQQSAQAQHAADQALREAETALWFADKHDEYNTPEQIAGRAVAAQKAREKAELDQIHAAGKAERWRALRAAKMAEKARARREAEEGGRPFLDVTGPLPETAPIWFEKPADGLTITVHKPSIPQPVVQADGTTRLEFDFDVITGQPPGTPQLAPEAQFAARERGEIA